MNTLFRTTALAVAAAGLSIPAIPAAAADFGHLGASRAAPVEQSWEHGRDRGRHNGWNRGRGNPHRYDRNDRYGSRSSGYYQPSRSYYAEPVYRDTRVWRGNDGRTYCRKRDGTTGLIVGAAAGCVAVARVDHPRQHLQGSHEVAALEADVLNLAGGHHRGPLAALGLHAERVGFDRDRLLHAAQLELNRR